MGTWRATDRSGASLSTYLAIPSSKIDSKYCPDKYPCRTFSANGEPVKEDHVTVGKVKVLCPSKAPRQTARKTCGNVRTSKEGKSTEETASEEDRSPTQKSKSPQKYAVIKLDKVNITSYFSKVIWRHWRNFGALLSTARTITANCSMTPSRYHISKMIFFF